MLLADADEKFLQHPGEGPLYTRSRLLTMLPISSLEYIHTLRYTQPLSHQKQSRPIALPQTVNPRLCIA